MNRTIYIIRHKPTGYFLPARKRLRGFSWDEPQPDNPKLGPRIFYSLKSAQNALTAWLQGCFEQKTIYSSSFENPEPEIQVIPKAQVHRKRADMEIVICLMTEVDK